MNALTKTAAVTALAFGLTAFNPAPAEARTKSVLKWGAIGLGAAALASAVSQPSYGYYSYPSYGYYSYPGYYTGSYYGYGSSYYYPSYGSYYDPYAHGYYYY